jgi:hypothetical protein
MLNLSSDGLIRNASNVGQDYRESSVFRVLTGASSTDKRVMVDLGAAEKTIASKTALRNEKSVHPRTVRYCLACGRYTAHELRPGEIRWRGMRSAPSGVGTGSGLRRDT